MTDLYNKIYSKAELLKKVGHLAPVSRGRSITLEDGIERLRKVG